MFLTKSIIVGYFDMGIFQEEGIITDILALHDANRGDKLTVGTLLSLICLCFLLIVFFIVSFFFVFYVLFLINAFAY